MLGFKTLTAPGVRSDHARPQDNTGTDMPVLLPFRAKHNKDGFFVHHDGRLFVDMKLRHGLMIFAVFALWGGAAEAAAKVGGLAWAMASLWEWTPFILKGFSLNILISVLAMLIGTIAGAALGLMQVSLLAPVRGSSWIVTQFFRNSPWLVLLFCVMLLFPHKTALENIMMAPIHVLKQDEKEVEAHAHQLIKKVRLEGKENSYPGELSGGQQQRVAIARSLAMSPDVMLFDEVTAALDPETVKEVLVTIQDLAEEGMTCILVTHEMGFAKEVANHVYFTDKGVIVEHGPPDTFFDDAKAPRTQEFLGQIL